MSLPDDEIFNRVAQYFADVNGKFRHFYEQSLTNPIYTVIPLMAACIHSFSLENSSCTPSLSSMGVINRYLPSQVGKIAVKVFCVRVDTKIPQFPCSCGLSTTGSRLPEDTIQSSTSQSTLKNHMDISSDYC